jgi:hypothetical protein
LNETTDSFSNGSLCDAFVQKVLKSKNRKDRERTKVNWEGFLGCEQTPSPEDWQELLRTSSLFMYWGCGSVTSLVEPKFISVLDLTGKSF